MHISLGGHKYLPTDRSSCPDILCKKGIFKHLKKSRKSPILKSLFNKVLFSCEFCEDLKKPLSVHRVCASTMWGIYNADLLRSVLTLSWRRPLWYRNESIEDLQSKSMDCFLYDNGLRHKRGKLKTDLHYCRTAVI